MTADSEKARQSLLALRAELEAIAAESEHSAATVELDQSRVGRLSRMDALQGQAMAKASARRRELALRNISAAMQRIDDGIYGRCKDCDELIASRRLEFDPTAMRCIDCESEREQS